MSSEKIYTDKEWEKKIKELEYWEHKAQQATSKNKFKPFIDSMGEIVDRKLVLKQEALDAFRVGKAGERLDARKKKLTAPERLYAIEVEESLVVALSTLTKLYRSLPKELKAMCSEEELEFVKYITDRTDKMRKNLYHKKDRIARPEVYTDINHRYDTQKRSR